MIEEIIQEYEELLNDLERKCADTQSALPIIPCPQQCYDCCNQIFPLSFLEAYYISKGFRSLERKKRRELERKTQKILYKLPEIVEKDFSITNISWAEINEYRAKYTRFLNSFETVCPFLEEGKNGHCSVYKHRNHDCRVHGYTFDKTSAELIGCFRFKELFPNPAPFIDQAFDFNYRYQDKLKLDQRLIIYLTKDFKYKNIIYLTNPFVALLKNFEEYDWQKFFSENTKDELAEHRFSIIIDNKTE